MIYKIINSTEFAHWVATSDNYKNNFSYDGANALQEYLEELSADLDENIEFDPIAWCCEYSEYKNLKEACAEYGDDYFKEGQALEDYTTVIEFDGGVIVQDF